MKVMPSFNLNLQALFGGIFLVSALRMAMAPYPNIEPVMLFTLTAGLAAGPLAGLLIGAGSMILSNILMATGPLSFPWLLQMPLVTLYTSLTYGAIGVFAGLLGYVKKSFRRRDYALLAGAFTLFYDLVTCVCFALQFYGAGGIPMALTSQVPFTLLHLSNVVSAFIFAPYLYKAAVDARDYSIRGLLSAGRQDA
jgi:hypothetical protein